MSKKSDFRGSVEKQDIQQAQELWKSEQQHLYRIYWSMWKQLALKQSQSHAKSQDSLLTQWLRMTSILFLLENLTQPI